MGAQFLTINAAFYVPLLFVNIVRLSIQGMGYTRVAMLAGLSEMIARTAVAVLLVPVVGFTGACFANPAAWVLADLFLFPCYRRVMRACGSRRDRSRRNRARANRKKRGNKDGKHLVSGRPGHER